MYKRIIDDAINKSSVSAPKSTHPIPCKTSLG